MKYAKVINDVIDVISLSEPNADGWVPVGDQIHAGFVLVDGQFVEADRPPAFTDASAAYTALVAWVNDFTAGFAPAVPDAERQAFAAKEAAARAYIAGIATETQTALLTDEAEITGETLNDLAAVVIAKANVEARISARVSGLRRTIKDELEAATDPFQLEEILDAAKATAAAMADALGLPSPTTQPQPSEGA